MNTTKNFEKKLRSAFKKYGFLFPTTEEEVKQFELLYGTTDIEMPEKFKTPDFIWSALKKQNGIINEEEPCSQIYSMAARDGKGFPKEIIDTMHLDRTLAIKKATQVRKTKR